jgi:hypothetical protein
MPIRHLTSQPYMFIWKFGVKKLGEKYGPNTKCNNKKYCKKSCSTSLHSLVDRCPAGCPNHYCVSADSITCIYIHCGPSTRMPENNSRNASTARPCEERGESWTALRASDASCATREPKECESSSASEGVREWLNPTGPIISNQLLNSSRDKTKFKRY